MYKNMYLGVTFLRITCMCTVAGMNLPASSLASELFQTKRSSAAPIIETVASVSSVVDDCFRSCHHHRRPM